MQSITTIIAGSLDKESKATHQLIQLLTQEQAELINADIDGLSALTEEKAKVVAQLSELAQQRYKALKSAGFDPMEAGMQDWIRSSTENHLTKQAWNDLLTLAKTAKELNHTNGVLISRHLAHNHAALSILHGNAATGNFYGPNGQSSGLNTPKRNLVIG